MSKVVVAAGRGKKGKIIFDQIWRAAFDRVIPGIPELSHPSARGRGMTQTGHPGYGDNVECDPITGELSSDFYWAYYS